MPASSPAHIGAHLSFCPFAPLSSRNDLFGARDSGCYAWLWGSDVHSFEQVERRLETGNVWDSLDGV